MKLNLRTAVALLSLVVALTLTFGARQLFTQANPVISPIPNSHTVGDSTAVSITYEQAIDASSVDSGTFAIRAMQSGLGGSVSVEGGQIRFEPDGRFLPGELVQTTATTGTLFLAGGRPAMPTVWQFRVAPAVGKGILEDTGLSWPLRWATFDTALGDLDGDGDLDAVSAHGLERTIFWRREAVPMPYPRLFLDTGISQAVALGDLDADGDLDAYFGNDFADQVWLNDGTGVFSSTGQLLGNSLVKGVALGDLDGDGDLDAVTANYDFRLRQNSVWLNDGAGSFSSGPQLAGLGLSVALGDIDNDGDLDVVIGQDARSSGSAVQVWLNDGEAGFTAGGGLGAATSTRGLAVGDLDGDGDADLVAANFSGVNMSNRVWLNDGVGVFSDSGQALGNSFSHQVEMGDLNGDGSLDLLITNSGPFEVWLNDSKAGFGRTEYSLVSTTASLGDLDGDGDLDALLDDIIGERMRLWRNKGSADEGMDLVLTTDGRHWLSWHNATKAGYVITISNKGPLSAKNVRLRIGPLPYIVRNSAWFNVPSSVSCDSDNSVFRTCDIPEISSGTAVELVIEIDYYAWTSSNTRLVEEYSIPASVGGSPSDLVPENNIATLDTILYNCSTVVSSADCTTSIAWCAIAVGRSSASGSLVEPPFHLPDLYNVRDRVLGSTPEGRRLTDLYYTHDAEIGSLVLDDSDLRGQMVDTLAVWQPNLAALVRGEGDSATITAAQVQAVEDFLAALSAAGSPALQQVIAGEWAKLPPPDEIVGMSMTEARETIIGHDLRLPVVVR